MYSTNNEEKSSVCKRWNRKIETKMWKQFTVQGNSQYVEILPKILHEKNKIKGLFNLIYLVTLNPMWNLSFR